MPGQVTITDLENAKLDCETIAAVATSTEETVEDRLGNEKMTLTGAILRLGYAAPVAYTNGLSMTSGIQTVEYDDAVYAAKPSEVPFTTSGTFEASKFLLLDSSTATQQATAAAASAAAAAASLAAAAGRLVDVQIFTANGTWTKPSGLTASAVTEIEQIAGGGGGASIAGGTGALDVSTGGTCGGYIKARKLTSSLGATQSVTIGAAGGPGYAGGDTIFDTMTTLGGVAGSNMNAGTTVETVFGTGGGAVFTGGSGWTILIKKTRVRRSAFRFSATAGIAGNGGDSPFGTGGRGGYLTGLAGTSGANANELNSGAGGGGAIGAQSGSVSGGAGSAGYLIVRTYN